VLLLAAFTAVLIWVRHHENLVRLLSGTEPRIGAKRG
jgi:glycerol-3-phosphate acyltransferase PlsY